MERFLKSFAFEGLSYVNVEDSGEGKLYGLSVDYVILLNSQRKYMMSGRIYLIALM